MNKGLKMRMMWTSPFRSNLSLLLVLSTAWAVWLASLLPARAHEVLPAITDMELVGDQLEFNTRLNIESFIAGIDLSNLTDTNDSPGAADYDALRALSPEELATRFDTFWPDMQSRITVEIDGVSVPVTDPVISVGPIGNVETVRETELAFRAAVPDGAESVVVGWDAAFGTMVLRQQGVQEPYDGFLQQGTLSDPIPFSGGAQASGWQTFVDYIPVGFDHIVPKGLDHILFVLGLFFLSTRLMPLLTQISLFTIAHTITLALAALGYVNIPGSIVEPLIAASITYVAIENVMTKNLSPWRPIIVFLFGLLHGLGFASVLGEFGLPDGTFIAALIGFNIGVEVGQLAVVAVVFLCVWQAIRVDEGENEAQQGFFVYGVLIFVCIAILALNSPALAEALEAPVWIFFAPLLALFVLCAASIGRREQIDAYRWIVSIPASVFIGLVGAYWFVERVFL
ncbi:MAG: HupE/UreJ family protein [Pseudomonadota bacterium]